MRNRRSVLKTALGAAGATASAQAAQAPAAPAKKVHYRGEKPKARLFSGAVSYGNLLFIAGKGAHFEGDIKAHTKHVLDEVEKELVSAGSSMEKVLKCNVYLNDLKDYQAMNDVFRGRCRRDQIVKRLFPPRERGHHVAEIERQRGHPARAVPDRGAAESQLPSIFRQDSQTG